MEIAFCDVPLNVEEIWNGLTMEPNVEPFPPPELDVEEMWNGLTMEPNVELFPPSELDEISPSASGSLDDLKKQQHSITTAKTAAPTTHPIMIVRFLLCMLLYVYDILYLM